jgi:hypothetical protein
MMPSQTLSHHKLNTLEICRRRFQLRYLDRLAWPIVPSDPGTEKALERGRHYHQILHRHFLGLDASLEANADPILQRWWRAFLAHGPDLPPGERLPELQLTVPLGHHLLAGRFDLLVRGPERWRLYDWKTDARPRPVEHLRRAWQTRLYLALAVEGSAALGRALKPEQVSLTYWYANAPEDPPITFAYDADWHNQNWSGLRALLDELDRRLADGERWPLTDDLAQCRRCPYQVICNRATALLDLSEWEHEPDDQPLEPDHP